MNNFNNNTFTNDLKRKFFFSKDVHSYRVCSFKSCFLYSELCILEVLWSVDVFASEKLKAFFVRQIFQCI